MILKIKRLTETAKIPTRAYGTDSGLDIYIDEDIILQPLQRHLASTGIAVEIPDSYSEDCTFEITLRPKSGLSNKGLYIALGTIDNGYTGELKVVMINLNSEYLIFNKGDKIAQAVIQKVYLPLVIEVEELNNKIRQDRGFGSSGHN